MPLHLYSMFCVCIPVPRFCRRSLVRISSNLACVLSLGSLTWTPPRSPVPRLEGQVRTKPRCSFHMNPWLCFLKISSICQSRTHTCSHSAGDNRFMCLHLCVHVLHTLWRPTQKRLNTSFMLPPCCMEMTRRWSSSFTQTRKVLFSLCL